MKKVILLLSVFIMGLAAISCDDDDPAVPNREIQLDKTEVAMFIGDNSEVMISQGTTNNDENVEYTAVAENDNITVKVMGNKVMITANKTGKTKVTVTDVQTQKTAEVTVTVKAIPEITVDVDNLQMIESQVKEVEIKTGSGNYTVTSSSENNLTAKVENNKVVLTAVKCDESGFNSTEVKVTITDAKSKTKEITVNVFQKVDISRTKVELFAGETAGIGLVSGNFDMLTVESSDKNVATAELDVAENGLKQVKVTAAAEGTCTINVTDGVVTKKMEVTVKAVAPITIWGPDAEGNEVELKEFDLKGTEQYFTVKGGTGKFTVTFDENKLSSNGITDNEDGTYLLHIARNPEFKDGGAVTVKVAQEGNTENSAEIKINIIAPLKFTYTKDGQEIQPGKDKDGDDVITVKLNDVVTLKVTGQMGKYYLDGSSLDSFEFTGLVEAEAGIFGKQKTIPSGSIDIKMVKKGEYYFSIKDYITYNKKWVTFKIE